MKVLHTSDWHLGRSLLNKSRLPEQEKFLTWLLDLIDREGVDYLLVAGDIFDNTTPSNAAQELYYDFLSRLRNTRCKGTVLVAGNHDSPSFLMAPQRLLKRLNIHIVGSGADPKKEIFSFDEKAKEALIVGAVPYLRNREVRISEAGESITEKEDKTLEGIRRHYAEVYGLAEAQRSGENIPIILMGHLFAAGAKTKKDDGVRRVSVGSLGNVPADIFSPEVDYVALGHLHGAQKVAGKEHIRYSGSPLPMSFNEAGKNKSLSLLTFQGRNLEIEEIDIPLFQRLEVIKGDLPHMERKLEALCQAGEEIWVEAEYIGGEIEANLPELLNNIVKGSLVEILIIKDSRHLAVEEEEPVDIDELTEFDVFASCMEVYKVPEEQKLKFSRMYEEIILSLEDETN